MTEHDPIVWKAHAHVDKYDDEQTAWVASKAGVLTPVAADFDAHGVKPYDTADAADNLLTTAGLNRLTALLIAAGGQALTNTATRLGTGNSATAEAVGQTDLQAAAGAANRWFQIMDATYPTQANGVVTLKATFATGDGNFVWSEWGTDVAAPTVASSAVVGAVLFNRKVASLGTKVSGSWALTTTITLS